MKQKYIREVDASGFNLVEIDGEKTDLAELNTAVAASSLLSAKRMVVIENLFSNKQEALAGKFLEFLKKKKKAIESNIIIIWDSIAAEEKGLKKDKAELLKYLAAQKISQEFKPLSASAVVTWIKKEAEARGGQISASAASALAGIAGSDLWQISNEIEKLVNFKAGQKLQFGGAEENFKIEVKDVEELVSGVFDDKIFSLTDAIGNKSKAAALKLIEEQIAAGNSLEYILAMVARQFKILLMVRQEMDNGASPRKLASTLKLHPFVAQKSVSQARYFSVAGLKNLLDGLLKIDYLNKTGQADPLTSLDVFLVRL